MCLVRCHAHDPLGGGAGSYWLARPYNVICSRVSREEVVLIISHICNCMTAWFPFLLFAILSLFKVWLFKFSWLSLNFFVKSLQRPCKVNLIQAGRQWLHLWYSIIKVCMTNSFCGIWAWYFPNKLSICCSIILFVFSASVQVLGRLSDLQTSSKGSAWLVWLLNDLGTHMFVGDSE